MKVEGFARMDISTSIHDDPKFRTLARLHPSLASSALATYVVLLAESWREGERLTLEQAWSPLYASDDMVVQALMDVGLIDGEQRIPLPAWERHFGGAFERRQKGRERQRRADSNRGRRAQTESTLSPIVSPTATQYGRQAGRSNAGSVTVQRWTATSLNGDDGHPRDVCVGCGQRFGTIATEAIVLDPRTGRPWHRACPVPDRLAGSPEALT